MSEESLPLDQQMRDLFGGSAEPTVDRVAGVIAGLAKPPATQAVTDELNRLAEEAPDGTTSAEAVMAYVFSDLGFRGNRSDYYDPGNSYLHRVIERQSGIPISLTVIAVEIGRRLGVPLTVVGFPGHVLIGDGQNDSRWFDSFQGGRVMTLTDCEAFLTQMFPGARLDPTHTQVLSPSQVAHRMLGNLKQIYLGRGDFSTVIRIADIGVALPDAGLEHHVELAKLLAASGRTDRAADVHDGLVTLDDEHADEHRQAAERLRWRRN